MKLRQLLPPVAVEYHGSRLAFSILVGITCVSTVRSLIHLLAPDGGAHSIAGLTIDVAGGKNMLAVFAQWGASQLILALFQWLVVLRYRFLVPALLATVFLEQVLRILAGHLKSLDVTTPPPGVLGTYVVLVLSFVALVLSLRTESKMAPKSVR